MNYLKNGQMMKKIKSDDYFKRIFEEEKHIVEKYNEAETVNFSRIGGTDFKKVQFGISWRSIGQVDIETAKWFVEFLNDTIKVAEKLNEEFIDVEIDWSRK